MTLDSALPRLRANLGSVFLFTPALGMSSYREKREFELSEHIKKATNDVECAPKQKHVRCKSPVFAGLPAISSWPAPACLCLYL